MCKNGHFPISIFLSNLCHSNWLKKKKKSTFTNQLYFYDDGMVRYTLKMQFREAHMDDGARTPQNPPCHKSNEKTGKKPSPSTFSELWNQPKTCNNLKNIGLKKKIADVGENSVWGDLTCTISIALSQLHGSLDDRLPPSHGNWEDQRQKYSISIGRDRQTG